MKISGTVKDIERRDVDGKTIVSFWLEQVGGPRTPVEVRGEEQVTQGEQLEVEGRLNSEGTLVAEKVTRPKKPEPGPTPLVRPIEPVPPQPPPKPTNWKLIGGIVAVLAVIVIIWAASSGGGKKEVPDLTDLSESEAATKLSKAGMKLGAARLEAVDDAKVGKVIAQTPAAGEPIAEDPAKRTATIVVGAVGVPKLIDTSADTAALELKRKGLNLGQVKVAPRIGGNSLVSDQSPGFGTPVRRGADVAITLATPLNIRIPMVYEELKVRPDFRKLDRNTQLKLEQALKQ